ncbi:MAG: invasin domain 3-containing protein [Ardenticatenales bacterium]
MLARRLVRRDRTAQRHPPMPVGIRSAAGVVPSHRAVRALAAAGIALSAAVGLLAAAPQPAAVHAATVRVVDDDAGCGGATPCYTTIQAAVDAAKSGDTIRLRPGTYAESVLVVDKALSFEGAGVGGAAHDRATDTQWSAPSGSQSALVVDAFGADITATLLSGIRFQGFGSSSAVVLFGRRAGAAVPPGRPPGGSDTHVRQVTVRACRFDDAGWPPSRLAGFTRAADSTATPDAAARAALVIVRAASVIVEDDSVVGTGRTATGVVVVDADAMTVQRTRITGFESGLQIVETAPPVGRATLVLGGAPADANHLGGNRGPAVELFNGAGAGTTSDVLAGGNDWGASTTPEIEARIVDGRDAAGLGRVRWRPPVGVPAALTLAPTPPQIEADGRSTADIVASVTDAAGRAVADGTLVSFVLIGPGTLQGGGGVAEAEGGAVTRTGEWGTFNASTYGPNSGAGYVRSEHPGDTLTWSFDAPAALLRLGYAVGADARLSIVVDALPAVAITTGGDTAEWVDHAVARELGPGRHSLTLTVVSGKVAVDVLAAGPTTRGGVLPSGDPAPFGVATAKVVAPDSVGEATVQASAWGAGGRHDAVATLRYVAGLPAAVRLSFGAPRLVVGGRTTSVTASVDDARGRPAPDGTLVQFAASGVALSAVSQATSGGRAMVDATSGAIVGPAVVTATVGAGVMVTATLAIVPGGASGVTIEPSRPTLTANSRDEARLIVTARDALGNPVADGVAVEVTTDRGVVTMDQTVTSGGRVTGTLRAGGVAGPATVRAVAADGANRAEGTAVVTLLAPDLSISKVVEPESVVVPGERVTYTMRYRNNGPGAVYDVRIEEPFPQGLLNPRIETFGPPLTSDDTTAYAFTASRLTAGQSGSIVISALVDTSLRWGRRFTMTNQVRMFAPLTAEKTPADNSAAATIVIAPESVYTLTITGPLALPVGGASAELVIRAFDQHGRPAQDGTPVSLSAEPGMGMVSPELVTTERGVARATFVSDRRAGLARVRALSIEGRGAIARIQITPGPPTLLDLIASRASLPVGGASMPVTVTLRDQYGNRVGGEDVRFESDLGSVAPAHRIAAASGVATATLASGTRAGLATLVARAAARQVRLAIDFLPGPPASVDLTLSAVSAPPGARVRGWATVRDGYGNPVPGIDVAFSTEIGHLEASGATTGPDGRAALAITTTIRDRGAGFVRAGVSNGSVSLRAEAPLAIDAARIYLPLAVSPRR